jgi:signal transduction histidine kinase
MDLWQRRQSEPDLARRPVVWVLDDSPNQGTAVARVLGQLFHVRLFQESTVLLEAQTTEQPDVLVLDWCLPDISGLDVLRVVRASHDEVTLPVLVLTASGKSRSDVLAALNAGANDFATIPFVDEELSARVATLARIRHLHARARRAEQANELARSELQGRADFEQQLIGIVSHDLRTPVGAIALGTALLSSDPTLPPKHARVVDRISASTSRVARMIADLLDLTAVRFGRGLPMTPAPVDLHQLTQQVLAEVKMAHPERQLDLQQAGNAAGMWDGDRISQVVSNLVTNAIHYSPNDTVVAVETHGDERAATLIVRNHGAPIPEELLSRLFLPMERGEPDAKSTRRSVGLGLFIVDNIVRAHGGTIEVRSTSAEGTVFTVCFPKT